VREWEIGGGPLGHPRVFINLDKQGPHMCTYWYVFSLSRPVGDFERRRREE